VVSTLRNELITLITTKKTRNGRGFEETEETVRKGIFAEVRSAGVIEKYEAQRAGIDVSAIFRVDTDSYKSMLLDGKRPDKVEHDGEEYRIHDVRRKGSYKKTEIVCKR